MYLVICHWAYETLVAVEESKVFKITKDGKLLSSVVK